MEPMKPPRVTRINEDVIKDEIDRRIEEQQAEEEEEVVKDEKYIVFKRHEFFMMMGYLALPPWRDEHTGDLVGTDLDSAPLATHILDEVEKRQLNDAVVIRRQDYIAAPALNSYASLLGLVAMTTDDQQKKERLREVADYFHQQAEQSAHEAWKFPD